MALTFEPWFASQLTEEASILKERRKDREEHDFLVAATVPEKGKRKRRTS